jgi:hypothetical protein
MQDDTLLPVTADALARVRETYDRTRAHESVSGSFALDDIEVLLRLAHQPAPAVQDDMLLPVTVDQACAITDREL